MKFVSISLCLVLLAIGIQAQGEMGSYGSGDGMGEGGFGGSPGMGEKGMGPSAQLPPGMGEKGMGPSGSKSGSMMAGQGVFATKSGTALMVSSAVVLVAGVSLLAIRRSSAVTVVALEGVEVATQDTPLLE